MKKRSETEKKKRTHGRPCARILNFNDIHVRKFLTKENDISSRYRINQIESIKFVDQNSVYCCSDSVAYLEEPVEILETFFLEIYSA